MIETEYFPSLRKRLITGGAWVFLGKITTAMAALIMNGLLARLLAPGDVGNYFIVSSLALAFALLAGLGLNNTVIRLVAGALAAGSPGKARAAIFSAFRIVTVGMLGMTAIVVVGFGDWIALKLFQSPAIAGLVGLSTVWMSVIALQNLTAETFRAFHDIRMATIFGGLLGNVVAAFAFALLWAMIGNFTLSQAVLVSIVSLALSAIPAGILLYGKTSKLEGAGEIRHKDVLSIAWPLLVTDIMLFGLTQSSIWILGVYLPSEEVALYGAAARLIALVSMPLIITNAVVPPLIAEMHTTGSHERLENILRTAATVAAIPACLVLGVLFLMGDMAMGIVYGDYYRAGVPILLWLGFGQIANVWTGSCGLVLMLTGHQATMMRITFFCGVLVVLGSLGVIETYGAEGVAAIAGVGMVVQNILMLYFVKKSVGIWTHAQISPKVIMRIVGR